VADIEIFSGKKGSIRIREISSIDKDIVITRNGIVDSLEFSKVKYDSLSLFEKINKNDLVFFYVNSTKGGGFHSNEKILVFKFRNRIIIGYSFDGCDLYGNLEAVASKFYIFPDEKFRNSFFSSIKSK
jgi:hypothetical protein